MNFARNRIWLVPLLIVGSYPLWKGPVQDFLTVKLEEIDFVQQVLDRENPQFRMQDFVLYQSREGKIDLKLEADFVSSGDPGTSEYQLQGVRCFLYGDDDQHSVITGGEALYVAKKNLITIVDDVVVNGNDGEFILKTDALRYFTSYKVVKTATPIVLKKDKTTISGDSLMYNMKTRAFRITGDVQCEL